MKVDIQYPQETRKDEIVGLVQAAQKGQERAFEQLVLRSRETARSIAYSVVGTNQMEDVVQESYLMAFRRLNQLRNPAAFVPWLSRIVLHVSYRLKKKQTPTEEVPEMVAPGDHSQDVADSMVLRRALGKLHQRDRDILILHEMVGLSHPQIAYALRIPEGTARSRLFAARRRLKDVLDKLGAGLT